MKDDELRRGDYVLFYDRHKIGKVSVVDQVCRYSCLLLYNLQREDDNQKEEDGRPDEILVNYDHIHPIQLTPFMLERFGFVQDGCDYIYNIYDETGTILEDTIKVEARDAAHTKWWFKDAPFEYVHELQHLLKDFKINKKIVKL